MAQDAGLMRAIRVALAGCRRGLQRLLLPAHPASSESRFRLLRRPMLLCSRSLNQQHRCRRCAMPVVVVEGESGLALRPCLRFFAAARRNLAHSRHERHVRKSMRRKKNGGHELLNTREERIKAAGSLAVRALAAAACWRLPSSSAWWPCLRRRSPRAARVGRASWTGSCAAARSVRAAPRCRGG